MRLLLKDRPRVLNQAEAQRVCEAAIKVFHGVTATIDGPEEVMQPLADLGCRIDGTSVRFGPRVVDTVLGRIAELKARNDAPQPPSSATGSASEPPTFDTSTSYASAFDATADTRLAPEASGQGLIWHDPFTDEIRPSTKDDLIAFSHMCDALDIGRAHPTILPNDVPPGSASTAPRPSSTSSRSPRSPRGASSRSSAIRSSRPRSGSTRHS